MADSFFRYPEITETGKKHVTVGLVKLQIPLKWLSNTKKGECLCALGLWVNHAIQVTKFRLFSVARSAGKGKVNAKKAVPASKLVAS